MPATLAELAALVQGELQGDGDLVVHDAVPLDDARPGALTLIDSREKTARLATCGAAAAVVPLDVAALDLPAPTVLPVIRVADVHAAFETLVRYFRPPYEHAWRGVSPDACVSPSAKIDPSASVHALAVVGEHVQIGPRVVIHSGAQIMPGCRIAADVVIFPNVTLYENSLIGPRCTLHSGVVIGGYGFGYRLAEGQHRRAAQLGFVELESDVEVGPNSTIDRGTFGRTLIGQGTKIDNQVQIAHNCRIGKHNIICAQVGIAGSTTSGDYVVMAGQCGIRDHVHIGARSVLGAMSGVTNDVADDSQMLGIPATPIREQRLKLAALAKLPEMRHEFKALMARVTALEAVRSAQTPPSKPQAAA